MSKEITSVFSDMQAFNDGWRMAGVLSASKLVPQSFQNNQGDCLIALEMANRMGANPMAVMQNLYIVHGKPSWSSSFIIASINQSGKFKTSLMFEEIGEKGTDSQGVIAYAIDHENNRVESPAVTISMAKSENWYSKSGSKWKTMPDLMMRYRAASFFGRLYTPDLLMGLKSQEEQQDIAESTITAQPSNESNLNNLLKDKINEVKDDEIVINEVNNNEQSEEPKEQPPVDDRTILRGELLRRKVERKKVFDYVASLDDEQVLSVVNDAGALDSISEDLSN